MKHYLKQNYIINGKISSRNKKYIKDVLLKKNTFANSDKFINSLEKMVNVQTINLLNAKKKVLLIEGEHHYLEDINIFFQNKSDDIIFSYQVKGNSQYKDNGDVNRNSIHYTVLNAIFNFIANKNIDSFPNMKFIVLTNRDIPSFFFLKDKKDKKLLLDSILSKIENISYLQKELGKVIFGTQLLVISRDIVLSEDPITIRSILDKFFKENRVPLSAKRKKIIIIKINDMFIEKLKRLRYIVNNLKVIEYLDHRLIYMFLNNFYSTGFHKILTDIEIKEIDGTEVKVVDINKSLIDIGFF